MVENRKQSREYSRIASAARTSYAKFAVVCFAIVGHNDAVDSEAEVSEEDEKNAKIESIPEAGDV